MCLRLFFSFSLAIKKVLSIPFYTSNLSNFKILESWQPFYKLRKFLPYYCVITFPVWTDEKSSALMTQWAHYKAGPEMLVVSGPPTVKFFFFLFRGNGNSSLCVKFGPGNKECVNCLAHISGVPFKDSFKLHWTHSVVCCSPSHSCLYWSLVISKGSYLWWCMSDIVYSAGKGLWEWNRKTNLIAH